MSAVATAEHDTPITGTQWTRTAAQQQLIRDHLERVNQDYANADPELRELLQSPEILTTRELMVFLGWAQSGNRLYQMRTKARDLAAAGQTPHPSAMPLPDAYSDRRGETEGTMLGRAAYWGLQSGRMRWDPYAKELVFQDAINFGGAPTKRK